MVCPTVDVLGATYANCDGRYKIVSDEFVEWAPERRIKPSSMQRAMQPSHLPF